MFGVLTIIGGILAASGYIISKKPNAKEIIDKLTPYRVGIGVVMFIIGVLLVLKTFLNLGNNTITPVSWLLSGLMGLTNLGIGFLLGYDLISEHLLKQNIKAEEKGMTLHKKLIIYQSKMGLAAIAIGILSILF